MSLLDDSKGTVDSSCNKKSDCFKVYRSLSEGPQLEICQHSTADPPASSSEESSG